MKNINSVEDIFPAIEELIIELRENGNPHLASILAHRMHEVSWTSGTELLEELLKVLSAETTNDVKKVSVSIAQQIKRVKEVIESHLGQLGI